MDNSVKIFFIAVILLYTGLGVAAVSVFHSYILNDNVASINQANSSSNNSFNNQTAQPKSHTKYIGSLNAIAVVSKNIPAYPYTSYSTKLVQNGNQSYYVVDAYDLNPNSTTYNQGIGDAKVDAKTGKLIDNGTITHI
jgi:hypothetical protein